MKIKWPIYGLVFISIFTLSMFMANAKDIVMEYFQATDHQDWQSARSYLSDNISYSSRVNSLL